MTHVLCLQPAGRSSAWQLALRVRTSCGLLLSRSACLRGVRSSTLHFQAL